MPARSLDAAAAEWTEGQGQGQQGCSLQIMREGVGPGPTRWGGEPKCGKSRTSAVGGEGEQRTRPDVAVAGGGKEWASSPARAWAHSPPSPPSSESAPRCSSYLCVDLMREGERVCCGFSSDSGTRGGLGPGLMLGRSKLEPGEKLACRSSGAETAGEGWPGLAQPNATAAGRGKEWASSPTSASVLSPLLPSPCRRWVGPGPLLPPPSRCSGSASLHPWARFSPALVPDLLLPSPRCCGGEWGNGPGPQAARGKGEQAQMRAEGAPSLPTPPAIHS